MYYGASTVDAACPEDTLYFLQKNPRILSLQQDLFLKLMLLNNAGQKANQVGFKDVPEVGAVAGTDKIEVKTGTFLNFDTVKTPVFGIEQANHVDQATHG